MILSKLTEKLKTSFQMEINPMQQEIQYTIKNLFEDNMKLKSQL